MRRRWGLLGVIIGVAIGAAVLGWIVGRQVRSPDEVATQREAPEPSLIAVPVESRVLNSNVIVRGDIRFSEAEDLLLDPGIAAGVDAVVTGRLPVEGDELAEGDVLIEVSTRPVIALQGALPMFRTLAPGSAGDDVRQLEEALTRLGHDAEPVDGTFDNATEAAIVALYRDLGYAPPGLEEAELAQLQGAEEAVEGARTMLRDAESSLARSSEGLSRSTRLQLDASLDRAIRSLDDARLEAYSHLVDADGAVATATANRHIAETTRDLADSRLEEAETGTHPDTGLPPTPADLAVLEAEADAAATTLAEADLALATAEEELARVTRDDVAMVADAEAELAIVRASRAEALAPPDTTFERRAVEDARTALERATSELTQLDAELGTRMPKSELVFLDLTPRRVDRVLVGLGDPVAGPVMRISGAEMVIDATVSAADRPLLSVGDRVMIDDQALDIELSGRITQLSDRLGGDESRYFMQVAPEGGDPAVLRGLNVRLTIPIESTGGEVLAVPLAALSAGPDGSARVQVERAGDSTELVTVTVGLSAQGFAEVEAVDGSLAAGDLVVVGRG